MYKILLFLSFLTTGVCAQTGRYLQVIDLTNSDNFPYNSNTYSLPAIVLEGITSGDITAYAINYHKQEVKALKPAEIKKALIQDVVSYEYGQADTVFLFPSEINRLQLDISRKKGEIEKINYIHVSAYDYTTEQNRYRFSLSFSDLAGYLDKKNALWVKNSSPLIWKDQVFHTDGYVADILYQQLANDHLQHLHLFKGADRKYQKFQIYDDNHQLSDEYPFRDFLSESKEVKGEIRLMSESLAKELYTFEFEEELNTEIPEGLPLKTTEKLKNTFMILFEETIYLKLPENKKFFEEGKELSTLVMNAVESGTINKIYTDASLSTPMTLAGWQENASLTTAPDGGWNEAYEGEEIIGQRVMYTGRSVSIISIAWLKHFNMDGEVVSQAPHSIGFIIAGEETPTTLDKLVGYVSFADVNNVLKDTPEAYYIEDLIKENYFSYWTSTSGITPDTLINK